LTRNVRITAVAFSYLGSPSNASPASKKPPRAMAGTTGPPYSARHSGL